MQWLQGLLKKSFSHFFTSPCSELSKNESTYLSSERKNYLGRLIGNAARNNRDGRGGVHSTLVAIYTW